MQGRLLLESWMEIEDVYFQTQSTSVTGVIYLASRHNGILGIKHSYPTDEYLARGSADILIVKIAFRHNESSLPRVKH